MVSGGVGGIEFVTVGSLWCLTLKVLFLQVIGQVQALRIWLACADDAVPDDRQPVGAFSRGPLRNCPLRGTCSLNALPHEPRIKWRLGGHTHVYLTRNLPVACASILLSDKLQATHLVRSLSLHQLSEYFTNSLALVSYGATEYLQCDNMPLFLSNC